MWVLVRTALPFRQEDQVESKVTFSIKSAVNCEKIFCLLNFPFKLHMDHTGQKPENSNLELVIYIQL